MLTLSQALCAQSLGIGYYDIDKLYDTKPSLFYDDAAYTHGGRNNWTIERYTHKIKNTAAVIDSMALNVVGLYGVENETVVRDIVQSCKQDYSYIHRTQNSLDGLDFALLYFGDKLFIESVESRRNMLIVCATMSSSDTPLTIILSREAASTKEYLCTKRHNDHTIILGRLYPNEIKRIGYTDTLAENEKRGEGNYVNDRGYIMLDRIATNRNEKILKSGVYITPWLLSPDRSKPLPSYDKRTYRGGYSKYLPIFTYIL